MATSTISIEVDADAASAYLKAAPEERLKLELLLSLRLRELTLEPKKPLLKIMDEIGAYAASQGMTQEVLQSLLHEDET